jgi:hypothetical protein
VAKHPKKSKPLPDRRETKAPDGILFIADPNLTAEQIVDELFAAIGEGASSKPRNEAEPPP